MCGKKDRCPAPMQIVDELAELARAGYIDSRGGFVQEQDRRSVDDTCGDGKLALHAFGIAAELSVRHLGQIEGV